MRQAVAPADAGPVLLAEAAADAEPALQAVAQLGAGQVLLAVAAADAEPVLQAVAPEDAESVLQAVVPVDAEPAYEHAARSADVAEYYVLNRAHVGGFHLAPQVPPWHSS